MQNIELEKLINNKLNSAFIQDYVPNGLQIEGRQKIERIITGVTICQSLINEAILKQADAIIVHHGFFWKNESPIIRNIKRKRIKTLLINDINLYSWHLPLDIHPELGNNACLASSLDIKITGNLELLVPKGEFIKPLRNNELAYRLENILKRNILHYGENAPDKIKKIAWCTGSGQGFIEQAAYSGMDAFISGEVSESTIHISKETGLNFYAIGHYASERSGIYALGKWLSTQYDLEVIFIEIYNPA